SRRIDIPEADMPPQKRACLITPAPGFEVGESSAAGAAWQPGPTESDLRRYKPSPQPSRSSRSSRDTAEVMVIDDKSWTLLGRHEREFYIGLEKLFNHCKQLVKNSSIMNENFISVLKFNRPDRNVDSPPPTCQFQVFQSIRQRHVDNDKDPKPEVHITNELFALACGTTWTPISINSCVVDGVRYVVYCRDERRITQNNGICSPGPDGEMYYGDQSQEVDVPPDIIDVVDEEDDITDDEDALPHDLADSDNEDLINVNDDGVDKMSADVARSHGDDCEGEDRPPPHHVPSGCMGCFANRAGRLNTRDKTQNLSLKEITYTKGPIPIQFELRDKQTVMPLGDHAAHWSSYIGEVIRGVPLYYPSWLKVLKERKAALIIDIETQFDLRPHMESSDCTEINVGIQKHLQKAYNTNKAIFKAQHWVIDPTTGTYNVEKIRRARTLSEPLKIGKNWTKSTVISRQSRSLAFLRDEMRQSSTTQEYPSLIDTFFMAHTVNGEFLRDEDRRIYEEMRRLEATSTYTNDEINRLARGGKQRGNIPGVGRVLPAWATASPSTPRMKFESDGASGSGGCGDDEEGADHQDDEDEDDDGDT
nr:hypothetical protein [Tanacetum cinerariifolium]